MRDLARELRRERRSTLVLRNRLRRRVALLEHRQRLDQRLSAHLGEMRGQLTTRHVLIDAMRDLVQDRARVHPRVELHDAHSRCFVAANDRPLDWRGAA